jgi:superfamily II DNA or RNA helicase
MLTIRPYQQTAIQNILADWRDGFQRLLLMAATGAGKTIIFLALSAEILRQEPRARILIIAHRRELIYQPIQRAAEFWPSMALRMGVVMADQDDVSAQIVVATVQSLVAGDRLSRILEQGSINYVIIDEAHHAPAGTYLSVLQALGNPRVLGCTATPKRSDRQALGAVFQKVSYKITIQDAIQLGALVPFTPLGFLLPADASGINETEDGWQDEPMGELLSTPNILEIVFAKWQEFSANRRTIGFTASVAQAHATAAHFVEMGVSAGAVDGTTPKLERDKLLRDFQSGAIQVVFNCMVLTEGFDAPETGCVMMIAPTRSDLVYVQRLGRGLRPARDKSDCLVLDFAPQGARNIIMAGNVLEGVPKKVAQTVEDAKEKGVILEGFQVTGSGVHAIDPHEIQTVVLNYLMSNRLAWSFDGRLATAALSDDAMVAILPPEQDRLDKADALRRSGSWDDSLAALAGWIGQYRLYRVDKVRYGPPPPAEDEKDLRRFSWQASCLGSWDSMTAAKAAAEELSKQVSDNTLSGKRNGWRDKPASESQLNYLRHLGGGYQTGLTSGQAAQRITHALARQAVDRAEKIKVSQIKRARLSLAGA